jgi:ribonuclease HI
MDDTVLAAVLDLERELQSPTARADEGRLRELLAPDFTEVGSSGRAWDRESRGGRGPGPAEDEDTPPIGIHDLAGRVIAPGVVLVSWDSDTGRRARRTSIWCERDSGWQQVHHQGTPLH